jgi:hypothetical protein
LYNLGLRWANGLVERSNVGSLAQLVEQRTFNPLVAGSNPARPTKRFKDLGENRYFQTLFAFLQNVIRLCVHYPEREMIVAEKPCWTTQTGNTDACKK